MAGLVGYSFYLSIHDNGEFRLTLSGCRGAEYYATVDDLLLRFKQFSELELTIHIHLLFTKDDSKSGFYLPRKDVIEKWGLFFRSVSAYPCEAELANKRTTDGKLSVPEFYYQRDNDGVGFTSVGKHRISTIVPYELNRGFDATINTSLYKK